VPATGDEIEALGNTLNQLLARLDAALARERRLLSDASHELRTPLTVLRTGIQVALRRERDASELREALESAGREAERVSRLAEDLLVLARADQGRLPVRAEALDVGALLEDAAERARTAASAAGRAVRVEVEQEGAVALADRDRAGQALDNLVANALAYGRGAGLPGGAQDRRPRRAARVG
jgi:two-component system, OmpR family, sensor kinase